MTSQRQDGFSPSQPRSAPERAVGQPESYLRREVIGDATLYLGNCMDLLASFDPAWSVVADPPYGISYRHGARRGGRLMGTDGKAIAGDDQPFDPAPWLEFKEALLWGAEHFKNRLPDGGRWLVWNKRRPGVVRDQGCAENAWCSNPGVVRLFNHPWDGADLGQERGEARTHSNQKPVDLMRWCLGFVTGETVLDPYMGSGTTGVACATTGRRFVGVEIDPDHFTTACRRIEEAYRQPRLFDEPPPAKPVQGSLLDGEAA